MRYSRHIFTSLLILLLICFSLSGHAKETEKRISKGEGPVDIEADELSFDRDTKIYQAHGQVEIARGDISLTADHAQLNAETRELSAWGNVLLREGEDVIECERLEINLDSRVGKILKAKLFLKDQNFHLTGQEVDKLGENHYRLREGSFTTCDAELPPWKFSVKEMEIVDLGSGGYGLAKGPMGYLEGIPVLYLPLAYFPIRSDRQTGFLAPHFVYSKKYGAGIREPFFWAISKNMDATLYLDYREKRGFKEGLEYRYALSEDTRGRFNFYFTDDRFVDQRRYALFARHQQGLPGGFYLKGDINRVSDKNYPKDFDYDLPLTTKIDARSLLQLRSTLFGGKNWDRFSFLVDGFVFQDLNPNDTGSTVQKLPQVSFYAHPQSLFQTNLFYDVSSSYTNFWEKHGVRAQRGDLFPRLTYPLRLFDVLKLTSQVGVRGTVYDSSDDPTHQFEGWKSRETFAASTQLSMEFFKVYEARPLPLVSSLNNVAIVSKWMHTFEPSVGYNYMPQVDQRRIPSFDDVDRIPYTNAITYGFTQRLIGKPSTEDPSKPNTGPYEYAKLKIFQSYSLGHTFSDLNGNKNAFSNIRGEFWWNFSPYLSAHWDGEYNPHKLNFDIFEASVVAKDKREDALVVGYYFTKGNIKGVNVDLRLRVLPPLFIYGGIRYDLLDSYRVENIYGIEYRAQCWTAGLTVEDINRSPDGVQQKEVRYQFYINLMGLATRGQMPTFMYY
jgi:LPS-assembly protein